MLHEVIIALAGHKSELFNNINLCVDLKDFIHPSERELLHEILNIAKNYNFMTDFIRINITSVLMNQKSDLLVPQGLYIQAFCEGLQRALEPFHREIVLMEKNILINPNMNLTNIFSQINGYSSVFSLLKSLINDIMSKNIHGCQLLQILHENIMNSVSESEIYLKCILKKCYAVFLQQTMSWLINGELEDPFNEYIIQKKVSKEVLLNECKTSSILAKKGLSDVNEVENDYRILIDYVPVSIHYSLANDILFVGKIVKVLTENPSTNIGHIGSSLIFGDQHRVFFERFASLNNDTMIEIKKLEELVKQIRTCVVEHLWQLAVEKENLYEELQLVKNFYLLGHGQFFKDLLWEASVFSLQSSKTQFSQGAFASLNEVMTEVASCLQMDEKALSAFTFKLDHKQSKKLSESTDIIWSCIKLQYTPKWPLNLIFTPIALEHYNKLFLFLLRVKRCHIEIHNVWKKDIKNKNSKRNKAWKLRNDLMFLINNLLYYLQVDVIETEYSNFINECRKIKDFKQIEKLHNIFLLNVLSHSFLLDIPANAIGSESLGPTTYSAHFYEILLRIVRVCEKFCFLVSKENVETREELSKLDKSFLKYKNVFMCFLAEYQSQPFKQHAVKLLIRLNFNKWAQDAIIDMPK